MLSGFFAAALACSFRCGCVAGPGPHQAHSRAAGRLHLAVCAQAGAVNRSIAVFLLPWSMPDLPAQIAASKDDFVKLLRSFLWTHSMADIAAELRIPGGTEPEARSCHIVSHVPCLPIHSVLACAARSGALAARAGGVSLPAPQPVRTLPMPIVASQPLWLLQGAGRSVRADRPHNGHDSAAGVQPL